MHFRKSQSGRVLVFLGFAAVLMWAVTPVSAGEKLISGNGPVISSPQDPSTNPRLQGPNWGTGDWIISQAAAYQFVPISSSMTWSWSGDMRYRSGGAFWFEASPNLPAGAFVQGLELYGCDDNTSLDIYAWLVTCPSGSCTWYGGDLTNGAPGCGWFWWDLSGDNITVDKFTTNSFIEVRLSAGDSTNRFQAVNIYYQLQVSPPPATATFTDVPTTHPFFQYVEALAASGITSGCTATKFCPNAPLTRGQMAVFLARALGLHWPN